MTKQAKRRRYRAHVKESAPYTRGKALLDVRTILGSNGHVHFVPEATERFQVGELSPDGMFRILGSSPDSWRDAVKNLRKSLDARNASLVKAA